MINEEHKDETVSSLSVTSGTGPETELTKSISEDRTLSVVSE